MECGGRLLRFPRGECRGLSQREHLRRARQAWWLSCRTFPQFSASRDGVITVFQAIVSQSWTARRLCSQGYLLLEGGCCVLQVAHLGEGEQEGERRFGALVSIDTVDMQAIPATT